MSSSLHLFKPETLAAMSPAAQSHLEPVLAQLEEFLAENFVKATNLAELSQAGALHRFMDCLPPIILDDDGEYVSSEKKAHLISFERFEDTYEHLPVIMALAHEGGNVGGMVAPNTRSQGLNYESLVHRLTRYSPQQLICTSGLLPGPKSTQIYCDFMKQMIAKHTSWLANECNLTPEGDKENIRHWFRHMEEITGQKARFASELRVTLDDRNLNTLSAPLEDFDLGEYEHLMNMLVPNHEHYSKYSVLDHLFLSDAFMMLEQSKDTALALKVLTAKARFWAEKLEPSKSFTDDLTEQLVACALFTHPEHFKRAGFGFRNLMGLQPSRAGVFSTIQDILAGPIALFSSSRMIAGNNFTFGLDRLLTYTQALLPEFSINTLIEHSGFSHTRIMELIKLQGGHCVALDDLLAGGALPHQWEEWLLDVIGETQSYAAYQPQSLAKVLGELIQKVKFADSDGPRNGEGVPFINDKRIKELRAAYFMPAMAANPGLKNELIAHLHTLDGVTAEHLQLTGISAHDVQTLVKKMSLNDQGKLFSVDLGL
jgi:hypothetical protein